MVSTVLLPLAIASIFFRRFKNETRNHADTTMQCQDQFKKYFLQHVPFESAVRASFCCPPYQLGLKEDFSRYVSKPVPGVRIVEYSAK